MKKFVERFSDLIELLRSESIIPDPQIQELEYHPIFNPTLNIPPQDWWVKSFEWYVAVEIVYGRSYGPFFRVGTEHFWPQIGKPAQVYSENQCFFGLEKPKNKEDARVKYHLTKENPKEFIHEFKIDNFNPSEDAFIFIGPVKDGTGYQMNPNAVTERIIKSLILSGKVKKGKLED